MTLQLLRMIKIAVLALLALLISTQLPPQQKIQDSDPSKLLTPKQKLAQLNQQLESLHPNFHEHFLEYYTQHIQNTEQLMLNLETLGDQKFQFLVLLGKMYLYDFLPQDKKGKVMEQFRTQARYLSAYFYFRVAAEERENGQAYYYLGLMEFYKLVPDQAIEVNLKNHYKDTEDLKVKKLIKYLQKSHLHNVQNNLYMSSLNNFDPASLSLGYMSKNRIGMPKNCTTSLGYYLSVIKKTYINTYYYRSSFKIEDSLEEYLYTRKKINEDQEEADFMVDTQYFDEEVLESTVQIAENYYVGKNGFPKNITKAVKLFDKLAKENNKYGLTMLGLCYFKGTGVSMDRKKAKQLFLEAKGDSVADYMLLTMKYYDFDGSSNKAGALNEMASIYKIHKTKNKIGGISSPTAFLIGATILKGELPSYNHEDALLLLQSSAVRGYTMSKVLLGILFVDGATGLKYGCDEAAKYFQEDSLDFPYFKDQVSAALVGLKKRKFSFVLFKYLELSLIGYENSYVNILYLLEMYKQESLAMNSKSWDIDNFKANKIYKYLRSKSYIPDIDTYLVNSYAISGKKILNYNNLPPFLSSSDQVLDKYELYIKKKVIRIGSANEKKSILKFYDYKLNLQSGYEDIKILKSIASGDASKLYVCQARYLLGKHHHKQALKNKTYLNTIQKSKIKVEYNRAIKSEMFGNIIFQVQNYFLLGDKFELRIMQSEIVEDLLGYIFCLSIVIFVFYYIRSKKMDQIHRSELQKMKENEVLEQRQRKINQEVHESQEKIKQKQQDKKDHSQPEITQEKINTSSFSSQKMKFE